MRENSGQFLFKSALRLLGGAIILSASISIYHVYHSLGVVREKTNEAVLAVATVNVPEFYGGARESDGFARHPEDGYFGFSIATDDVVDRLVQSLKATDLSTDDTITVGDSFTVQSINTQYVNYSSGNLNFRTTLTVTVPLSAGGILLPAVTKRMEVGTSYDPKF